MYVYKIIVYFKVDILRYEMLKKPTGMKKKIIRVSIRK